MTESMNTCCMEMSLSLQDPRDNIGYNKIFREYFIQTKRDEIVLDIVFCPWCGTKFTTSLRDDFFKILFDELNLDGIDDPKLPLEFRTDAWWKKRGL